MTARIVYAPVAISDVDALLTHLATEAGLRIAARYASLLERKERQLAMWAESGSLRPALGKDIRIAVITPYVLIYRYQTGADILLILRIQHGRQDISELRG